jgi:hypothetical protein
MNEPAMKSHHRERWAIHFCEEGLDGVNKRHLLFTPSSAFLRRLT